MAFEPPSAVDPTARLAVSWLCGVPGYGPRRPGLLTGVTRLGSIMGVPPVAADTQVVR
jgi:hypothetical protein